MANKTRSNHVLTTIRETRAHGMAEPGEQVSHGIVNTATLATHAPSNMVTSTSSSKQGSSECIFPLLNLPPEIWIRICKFAVQYEHEVVLKGNRKIPHHERLVRQPSITRTCKMIREEALPFFYSSNTFEIVDGGKSDVKGLEMLPHWFDAIRSANHAHITSLCFQSRFDDGKLILTEFLEGCTLALAVKCSEHIKTLNIQEHKHKEVWRHWLGPDAGYQSLDVQNSTYKPSTEEGGGSDER